MRTKYIPKSYAIYKATNILNKKVYIGQTKYPLHKRIYKHIFDSGRGCEIYFHRAINKYGIENFKWETLCCCFDQKGLHEMEVYFIALYGSFGKNGYNLTSGGVKYKFSDEIKHKISVGVTKRKKEIKQSELIKRKEEKKSEQMEYPSQKARNETVKITIPYWYRIMSKVK